MPIPPKHIALGLPWRLDFYHVGAPVGELSDRRGPGAMRGEIHRQWVRNIPTTVAAGTLEIQKNIVAQRGLGLPRSR